MGATIGCSMANGALENEGAQSNGVEEGRCF